jgi:hypothetical protein
MTVKDDVSKDITAQVANHLLHEWANFLNIIYLTESDIDVTHIDRILQFARAVYLKYEATKVINLYNDRHLESKSDCGVVAVLWYLYEKKITTFDISTGYIVCNRIIMQDFRSWPPIQYLQERGYSFNIETDQANSTKIAILYQ